VTLSLVEFQIDQKNTSGTCHFLGSSLVCLSSHKQTFVVQSTIEAEYVAVASCCSQILWIVDTMRDYGVTYNSVPLMCDSSNAICLAQNPVFHGSVKHIKVRHHFFRDHVEMGDIEMRYTNTERQLADIITKPLDATRFASLWRGRGGDLVSAIPMAWFEGELVFYLVYTLSYLHFIAFHSYLPNLPLLHLLY
jgi:hypothetical protein